MNGLSQEVFNAIVPRGTACVGVLYEVLVKFCRDQKRLVSTYIQYMRCMLICGVVYVFAIYYPMNGEEVLQNSFQRLGVNFVLFNNCDGSCTNDYFMKHMPILHQQTIK